jgi:hypothetical protein
MVSLPLSLDDGCKRQLTSSALVFQLLQFYLDSWLRLQLGGGFMGLAHVLKVKYEIFVLLCSGDTGEFTVG